MLLVVAYAPSVLTYNLENDTKVITIDRQMDLRILIWSIIILYKHNSKKTLWWRKNVDLSLWAVSDSPSVMTCHFEDDEKGIYPNRHIFLSFRKRKCFGNCCGMSLMASLSWVVIIGPITFMMIRVFFCYILIEVKIW